MSSGPRTTKTPSSESSPSPGADPVKRKRLGGASLPEKMNDLEKKHPSLFYLYILLYIYIYIILYIYYIYHIIYIYILYHIYIYQMDMFIIPISDGYVYIYISDGYVYNPDIRWICIYIYIRWICL